MVAVAQHPNIELVTLAEVTKVTGYIGNFNVTIKKKAKYVDWDLCTGCGTCIEKCPVKALSFGEDLGVFAFPVTKIDLEKCIVCGNCRRFCPDGAIGVDKNSK